MWIYIPSTSSRSAPESEDLISASDWRFQALEQSAWSRGKPRASKSWHRGWKTGDFIRRLFGRMPEPSMADRGVAEFMASLPVIPASHSASQASDEEPKIRDTSGPRSSASLGKWDPSSCSWRMSQAMFDWASTECSVILPKSGSTRSGRLFERPMSELHTEGSESSSWPTPRTITGGAESAERKRELGRTASGGGDLQSAATQWPTPNASLMNDGERPETFLARQKKWAGTYHNSTPLTVKAKQWATPTARDHKDGTEPSHKAPTNGLLGRQAPRVTGAASPNTSGLRLNPNFVEWLMGFPEGWTVCEPLATLSSRNKQHSHSGSSSQGSNDD